MLRLLMICVLYPDNKKYVASLLIIDQTFYGIFLIFIWNKIITFVAHLA